MIKRMDKRGEPASTFTIIMVVLGVITLGVVAFFIYKGSVAGSQVLKATDVEITLMEQKCNGLSSVSDLTTLYCYTKYETKKDKNYVNCQYVEKNFGVNIEDENKPADGGCSNDVVEKICNQISFAVDDYYEKDYFVNGEKCSVSMGSNVVSDNGEGFVCSEGVLVDSADCVSPSIPIEGVENLPAGKVCCDIV